MGVCPAKGTSSTGTGPVDTVGTSRLRGQPASSSARATACPTRAWPSAPKCTPSRNISPPARGGERRPAQPAAERELVDDVAGPRAAHPGQELPVGEGVAPHVAPQVADHQQVRGHRPPRPLQPGEALHRRPPRHRRVPGVRGDPRLGQGPVRHREPHPVGRHPVPEDGGVADRHHPRRPCGPSLPSRRRPSASMVTSTPNSVKVPGARRHRSSGSGSIARRPRTSPTETGGSPARRATPSTTPSATAATPRPRSRRERRRRRSIGAQSTAPDQPRVLRKRREDSPRMTVPKSSSATKWGHISGQPAPRRSDPRSTWM